LIPLILLAIVVGAGVYEFTRAPSPSRRAAVESVAPAPSAPTPASQTTTVLPNPLDNVKPAPTAPTSEKPDTLTNAATATMPLADTSSSTTTSTLASAPTAAAPSAAAGNVALLLTFKEKSWVEVKDGNGAPIFHQTGAAGTTQTVTGAPPLEVVVGNAVGVGLTFRGQPIDVAPFTHGNIARLTLK